MRPSPLRLAMVLAIAAAPSGCQRPGGENAAVKAGPPPMPRASPTPTIVIGRYRGDRSEKLRRALRGLHGLTDAKVDPRYRDLNGAPLPVALVDSSPSVDPTIDAKVCHVVRDVYHGAVIRKVGGIEPFAAAAARASTIEVTLPRSRKAGEATGPVPSNTTLC